MAVPTVAVNPASNVSFTSATGNGNITSTGGVNPTRRGFQYNLIDYPDKEVYEEGSFSTGAFTLTLTGLTPGKTYYYRAFAENTDGIGYSDWTTFMATAATYNVAINGVDRTGDILAGSLNIVDVLNDQQNTCSFSLIDLSSSGIPTGDQTIVITLNDGTKLFAGYILSVNFGSRMDTGLVQADINAIDYSRLLDSFLVHKTYQDMTDAQIIQAIVDTYCVGFGITTDNVVSGVTIDQISFNYLQPTQAFRRICDLTGRNWFIDYDKDIHYFPASQEAAPFNIDSSNAEYFNLRISKDNSQIKNRVYVRGGTKLSDFTTYSEKGDGAKRKFVLPDKPHDVTVTVNGVSKTVGVKNINTSGFDYYLNFQEKYLEQDSGATILSTTDVLAVQYKYDIPILVALENQASILESGTKEFAIFDKSITTTDAARDRASAELTDYAMKIIEGSFSTYTPGFRSGQFININLSDYGVNADYVINRVTARSLGAGTYVYDISLASAKTMGIIRFLIELLESNKNLIELDDEEVVDELFNITDSLLSDSLVDNLLTDSAGPYATWCTDSLQSSPTTRAIWDLFQWG